jgi:branched-chain amino acid transport system substrate-binding protein
MNRKSILCVCIVFAVVALVAVLAAGCGGSSTTTTVGVTTTAGATTTTGGTGTTATTTAPMTTVSVSQEPIVIGFSVGLSGWAATYEEMTTAFAQTAVDEINAKGGVAGRQIKTIVEDNKCDPAVSATVAQSLIDKGAEIIICTGVPEIGGTAARVAQDKGLLAFTPSSASPLFGPPGIGPLAFTMASSVTLHAGAVATFAYEKLGAKTSWLLEDTTASFCKDISVGWQKQWAALGGTIVLHDTFANGDASVAAQISKLKAISPAPDVLYLASYPPGAAAVIKQLRAAGINSPVLCSNVLDGETWYESIPDVTDVYWSSDVSLYGDDPDPKVNELLAAYRAAHPGPMAGGGTTGYAMIQVIAEAIIQAGTTDGKTLAATLEKFVDVPTVVGPTTFDSKYHVQYNRPMRVMKLSAGKHSVMGVFKPPTQVLGL